jgi:Na+-translocating ferredoxin:NAD+ oxidoreductase RnfD subunit
VTTSSAVRQFFRTPKGLLTIVLVILLACAAPVEGFRLVAPCLAAAIVTAALIDLFLLRWLRSEWQFPSGAILTGLLVAMVMSPREPWYVPACASAIAIPSKYVARLRSANVFNPAALALVATFYVFHTAQNWWGALPNLPLPALAVLFVTGVFIADRVNKMPLVLVFLGVYFTLFTATAFLGDPVTMSEIFRAPDLHAALFFAFFILTDPPTSPVKYYDQIICGALVAITGYLAFEWIGAVYYLLAGVLIGNIWEAWHRWFLFSRRHLPADAPGPSTA